MSDARPITNVTEYVCGSCWNAFGAADPGVRSTGGNLTCPHCGHVQAAVADLTSAVRAALVPAALPAEAYDVDDEVGIGVEQPASSALFAPKVAVSSTPAAPSAPAASNDNAHSVEFGIHDGPVDFAAAFAADFGGDVSDEPDSTTSAATADLGRALDLFDNASVTQGDEADGLAEALASYASDASAAIGGAGARTASAIAGDYELLVDTDEDTPVAEHSELDLVEAVPTPKGHRHEEFEDTVDARTPVRAAAAELPAAAAPTTRSSSSLRPTLKTAEELLAFLDATEDDDTLDTMFGSTLSTHEASAPDEPGSVDVRGGGEAPELADGVGSDTASFRRVDEPTGTPAPPVATKPVWSTPAAAAAVNPAPSAIEADGADDEADDEPDFDMVSENTAPELELASLEVEPSEWKLRAPPGLTYNFHSVDALLGWASNRSTDGLQVSIDGTVWRPVPPFLDALRAGHRGRKAFALAQVPEMVANMSADDSRSALDDIRDVDVRDEVIRSLEARAAGGVATLAGNARTRQSRPSVPAMDASDLGVDIDDDTLPAAVMAKTRLSGTMPAAKPGEAEADATVAGSVPAATSRPTVKTPLRPTGATPAVKAGGRGDRPATANQPAVTAGARRPTSTKHTPVVRKDEPSSKGGWIAVGTVVLVLAVVAGLQAAGILHLPLPWP